MAKKTLDDDEDDPADHYRCQHGFDGRSITGFDRIEESDMIAMPARAFQILRWRTKGDAHVLRRPPRDAAATPPST